MVRNPKLSQAISDVSWGEITRQLAYKCRWYGRNYIEVDKAGAKPRKGKKQKPKS
jgi:putative transposase